MPALMPGELGGLDVADLVDIGVVDKKAAIVDRASGTVEIHLRFDHGSEPVDIEKIRLSGVVDFPEGGGHAKTAAAIEAGLGVPAGAVAVGSDAFEDVGDDLDLAEGEGPVDFLTGVAAPNGAAGRAGEAGGGETRREAWIEPLVFERGVALFVTQTRASGLAEEGRLIVEDTVADAAVADLGGSLNVILLGLLRGVGDEIGGVGFAEEGKSFIVLLVFDVEGEVVRESVVEVGLIVFFHERGIGDVTGADLDLPIVGEEMFVLPEDSAAVVGGRLDVGAMPPRLSMPRSSMK